MLGQEKTPVSWAAVRGSRVDAGGYARHGASAASTRFPITTSNPGVCITVDGSLRTGQRSNSRHRRGGPGPCEPGARNVRWEDDGVSSPSASAAPAAVVIRISPMAHFAVGFFALGLLALVLAGPAWVAAAARHSGHPVGGHRPLPHGGRSRHGDRPHASGQPDGPLGRRRGAALRQGLMGVRATQGRHRAAAAGGDVRDAAVADRGQRRPRAESLQIAGQASGLPPLSSTHTAIAAPHAQQQRDE